MAAFFVAIILARYLLERFEYRRHTADIASTFPLDLRKRRVISMYERTAVFLTLDVDDFVHRSTVICSLRWQRRDRRSNLVSLVFRGEN
jgi:hypothetical protein